MTVEGTQVEVLFFTPGSSPGAVTRLTSTSRRNDLTLYLQDVQNNDGANSSTCPDTGEIGGTAGKGSLAGQPSCDMYVRPTATAFDRNRLFTIP